MFELYKRGCIVGPVVVKWFVVNVEVVEKAVYTWVVEHFWIVHMGFVLKWCCTRGGGGWLWRCGWYKRRL